jgi:hypothetical protein
MIHNTVGIIPHVRNNKGNPIMAGPVLLLHTRHRDPKKPIVFGG